MKDNILNQRVIIDEDGVHDQITWPEREFTVEIVNEGNNEPDMGWLHYILGEINNRIPIKNIRISHSSQLKDCSSFNHLSKLTNLQLYGKNICSLSGIEDLLNLEFIELISGKKRKRDISALSNTNVKYLFIDYLCEGEYPHISKANKLTSLRLFNVKEFESEWLCGSSIENMFWSNVATDKCCDLCLIIKLTNMHIGNCSKLLHFSGNNSNIRSLTIESCNKLEMSSIGLFENVVNLEIIACKKQFELNTLASLSRLEHAMLSNSNIAGIQGKKYTFSKSLKTLWINDLNHDDILKLSGYNSGLVITNGKRTYVDGKSVPIEQYYEMKNLLS